MEILKALFEWLWKRLELPLWPLATIFWFVVAAAVILQCFRHRAAVAALRTLAHQRCGRLVRGWCFWSPVAVIGDLRVSVSPAWIKTSASTAGRLWLDSRDIPDRHVKKGRGERYRTGDWSFDEAFDAVASSAAFAEKTLDADVRNDLLKLDAVARRSAPKDDEGKPLHRLRIGLDGRWLEVRFRHALDFADIPAAVELVERLGRRLAPPRP